MKWIPDMSSPALLAVTSFESCQPLAWAIFVGARHNTHEWQRNTQLNESSSPMRQWNLMESNGIQWTASAPIANHGVFRQVHRNGLMPENSSAFACLQPRHAESWDKRLESWRSWRLRQICEQSKKMQKVKSVHLRLYWIQTEQARDSQAKSSNAFKCINQCTRKEIRQALRFVRFPKAKIPKVLPVGLESYLPAVPTDETMTGLYLWHWWLEFRSGAVVQVSIPSIPSIPSMVLWATSKTLFRSLGVSPPSPSPSSPWPSWPSAPQTSLSMAVCTSHLCSVLKHFGQKQACHGLGFAPAQGGHSHPKR